MVALPVAAAVAAFLGAETSAAPGAPGGPGLALHAAKAIPCASGAPAAIERALLLVKDGRVEALGPRAELEVPEGYEERDLGEHWIMPGLVDLHSHVAALFNDVNDPVYQANPGLRASASIGPGDERLLAGLAGGVTTVLHIPGSATTAGGQGVLLKTGFDHYERMLVRDPGSLKVAQADNPKGWGWGMGRLFLNWQIRDVFRRGIAYAERWEAFEEGRGEEPERIIQLDVFRELHAKRTQVSAHTQVYQVVLASMRIMREEFGVDVYIDHGTFDGFLAAGRAQELGVHAILGPRTVAWRSYGRGIDHDGRMDGVAAEYQRRGHRSIGFNTDAPVVPQEQLSLQAAMAARYGLDDSRLETVRGLTIVPARAAGIADRVGSLEPGKDADVLVVTGNIVDPRESVLMVWIEGALVYDAREGRRF